MQLLPQKDHFLFLCDGKTYRPQAQIWSFKVTNDGRTRISSPTARRATN